MSNKWCKIMLNRLGVIILKYWIKSLGMLSSLGILIFFIIFSYFNPFNNEIANDLSRQLNIWIFIGLPSIINLIAITLNKKLWTIISLCWLAPFLLYIGLSKLPGLWNWFVVFVLIQAFTLIFFKKKKVKV